MTTHSTRERVCVVGLGYVGLPVALALAKKYAHCVGFDISQRRVDELRSGVDSTREADAEDLRSTGLRLTTSDHDLADATFFIVTVPTPIDADRRPDLSAVRHATETVGRHLSPGSIVVYESTVYPGLTEELCVPILESVSGLTQGTDFFVGYSPERINPGDKEHTLEKTTKVVAADTPESLDRVATLYESIVTAGTFRAASIRVAEAAKIIENTQRDLNIALMNELSLIFDRLGIRTQDVLAAASTKWNFLRFYPGLVGGHCIGVDPYYLTAKAEAVGYHPQVILAGRRINDSMSGFIAQRLVKMLARRGKPLNMARVGVLGLTFKEDVPDLRNSKVPDIVSELEEYGVQVLVNDPMADPADAMHEYGIQLRQLDAFQQLDGVIIAVPHAAYRSRPVEELLAPLVDAGVVVDVRSILSPGTLPRNIECWSL
ncbi:MAG: nucleotide sugar dehydrogenase [Myxococcota bacterium]